MAIDLGFSLFGTLFGDIFVFNISWIISILLTFITLTLISTNVKEWKTLSLPVILGWYVVGIRPFLGILVISGIFFVIDNLSIDVIGDVLTVSKDKKRKGIDLSKFKLPKIKLPFTKKDDSWKSGVTKEGLKHDDKSLWEDIIRNK